jgi:hypothetical protein
VLDHSQVVPSRRNSDSWINIVQLGTPKTHVSLVPQAQARPTRFTLVKGFRSPFKLGLQAPNTWGLASIQCLDLLSNNPPITVSPKRVETHDKRVTSLLAPISKYVLGIISL